MLNGLDGTVFQCFAELDDPRQGPAIRHLLIDIVAIAILAIIAGADDWEAVQEYGLAKQHWLQTFLQLPHGIPSHDTFNRVFARLDPQQLQSGFHRWLQMVCQQLDGEIIALDGKSLRQSFDRSGSTDSVHLISAWACSHNLVLGQRKVDCKSNEITAIVPLLDTLDVQGCWVSIDAMGCQKSIAQAIIDKQASYILALKGNQGNTYKAVEELFHSVQQEQSGASENYIQHIETGHGRIEIRDYWVLPLSERDERAEALQKWPGLKAIGMTISTRKLWNKETREVRYYLLSESCTAAKFGHAVRSHWGIENSLHWVLDVTFSEDRSRVRRGNGAENLGLLRRLALNLLKQEPSQGSMKKKRYRAGLSDAYMTKVISLGSQLSSCVKE